MHFVQLRFQEIQLGLDRRPDKRDQGGGAWARVEGCIFCGGAAR